jgi:oligopeptide transport system ATP-binding protein
MGMVEPTSGSVIVAGHATGSLRGDALQAHRRLVQVVLQDPYSSLDPRMRVGDIIAEPLTLGRPMGRRRQEIRGRVEELLRVVGLPATRAQLYPHQFSGGQRQRVAIARALAPRPELIVLDEPTSALDVSVRAQIINLLRKLQEELGVTYLVISHDLVSVAYLASTVAVMYLGRIMEIGPTKAVYQSPRHPYTLLLLASAPSAEGTFMTALPTEVTPPPQPEHGCRYYSRCALRAHLGSPERCRDEEPALVFDGDHGAACHFAERTRELVPPA